MKTKTAFLLAVTLPVALAAHSAYATTLFNDNFDSPSYTVFEFNSADSSTNIADISFATILDVASGGNPDSYLEVSHTHDVDRDEFGEPTTGDGDVNLQSFIEDQSTTYDASTNGQILDLTFELDVLLGPPGPEGGQFNTVFFIVHETGGGSAAGFTSLSGLGAGWNTITVSGLTNANFSARDFTNGTDLAFGFGFLSNGDVFSAGETFEISVDNFVVTANVVPEPSSLLLSAVAAIGLLANRKRYI